MTWEHGAPTIGPVFSEVGTDLRPQTAGRRAARSTPPEHGGGAPGAARRSRPRSAPQARRIGPGLKDLCMAGGVALNCTMNGKIVRETPFERVYSARRLTAAPRSAALYVKAPRARGSARSGDGPHLLGPGLLPGGVPHCATHAD
jgi:hypothetical protein